MASKIERKKQKGHQWGKFVLICVGVSQGSRLLFSPNAETIYSASITVIFGGALFYGIAYAIGYLSQD
jgi:hypothetical protein